MQKFSLIGFIVVSILLVAASVVGVNKADKVYQAQKAAATQAEREASIVLPKTWMKRWANSD